MGYLFDSPFGGSLVKSGSYVLWRDWSQEHPGQTDTWYCFSFYHSRFMAKRYGHRVSKLCIADKLAMQSYKNLLTDILETGEPHADRTGTGTTSVFGRQWRHDMREGFPLLTTKKVPLRWVFEELAWILSGSTDESELRAKGVDIWAEWATAEKCDEFGREPGDLGPVYGALWRRFDVGDGSEIDQVSDFVEGLKNSPHSRRHVVSGWHPRDCKRVALPPCHTLWQEALHLLRSFLCIPV